MDVECVSFPVQNLLNVVKKVSYRGEVFFVPTFEGTKRGCCKVGGVNGRNVFVFIFC